MSKKRKKQEIPFCPRCRTKMKKDKPLKGVPHPQLGEIDVVWRCPNCSSGDTDVYWLIQDLRVDKVALEKLERMINTTGGIDLLG